MPVGSMLPHARAERGTGSPRFVFQAGWPVEASKAYTESCCVATTTRPPETMGSPYSAPSSWSELHAWAMAPGSGPVATKPRRSAELPKVSQAAGAGGADDVGVPAVVVGLPALDVALPAADVGGTVVATVVVGVAGVPEDVDVVPLLHAVARATGTTRATSRRRMLLCYPTGGPGIRSRAASRQERWQPGSGPN